jgi:hypothetical protein
MKRSSGPRKTANLSESVQHHLNMYAVAAGAAAVSVLALAEPANAKIVYTKTHRVIELKEHYNLDLNHDGKIDFIIRNTSHVFQDGGRRSIFASGITTGTALNEVAGTTNKYGFLAAALKPGARIPTPHIRHSKKFRNIAKMIDYCSGVGCSEHSSGTSGNWVNVSNRYLGLMFKINGQTHYGWARLNVRYVRFITLRATLTGYAYETIPGRSVVAGHTSGPDVITIQPATLGELALGRK